jgi:hypothetical protein
MFSQTSNFELEDYCARFRIPLVSVCSKDQLKGSLQPGAYIVNMQEAYIVNMQDFAEGNGTHWVSICIIGNDAAYFDSFGRKPPIDVYQFVKRKKNINFYCIIDQIQDIESEACGFYCIAFLHYMFSRTDIEFTKRLNTWSAQFYLGQRDIGKNEGVFHRYLTKVTKKIN